MHSLDRKFLSKMTFTPEEAATLRQLGECRGRQDLFRKQRPEVLEGLRTVAVVESTESSNRLEGISIPHHRLEKIVLHQTAPRNRSEQEIAGYRDALNLIHESADDMPFTVGVVQQLHQQVFRYLPGSAGHWKMSDNEIVERHPDGSVRVRFRPVPAVATPHLMREFVEHFAKDQQDRTIDSLVLVPLAILDFLCIHPFTDGNGRVARLITLLLLYRSGYEVGRYISLERIFEDSKESYYETLESSSQGWHEGAHDAHPWLDYFWGVLLRAHREFEDRVGHVTTGRGAKTEQVRRAVRAKNLPFSISELERDCPGVSRELIRRVLREMRDAGEIETQGAGRGARWRPLVGKRPAFPLG